MSPTRPTRTAARTSTSPTASFGLELTRAGHAWSIRPGKKPDGLRLLDDRPKVDRTARVFPLGTDGSFRLYVLLEDGRVASVSEEISNVLDSWFPSLDDWLFTMLRLSATPEFLTRAAVIAMLEPIEGAEDEVEALREE